MDEFLTSIALAVSPELKLKRLETLEKIKTGHKCIVVTHLMGYLKFLTSKENYLNHNQVYKIGDHINRDEFAKTLDDYGYQKTDIVTATGEYAIRGYIIDISYQKYILHMVILKINLGESFFSYWAMICA